jgi:ABC-type nitrate/sulfonate/bicarbonate transport system substrate-binding protein
MMIGRVRALTAVASLFSVLAAAAPVVAEKPAAAALTRVKLVAPAYLTSAPFFVAADLGLFAEEGIEVEFVEIRHASASLPALAQGQVDAVGAVIGPAFFNLVSRGAPIRIVAGRSFEDPAGCDANAMVARSDLLAQGKLPNRAAMRGMRLSYDRTGASGFFVGTLLDSAGLTLGDMKVSDVAAEVRGEALARDLIDVGMAFEPGVTQALDTGGVAVWIHGHQIAPDFQFSQLLVGSRLLEQDRDAGRRFVRGYLRGVERYIDEQKSPRLIEILAKRTQLDPDLLRRACWPPTTRDGRIDRSSIERYQDWALREDLIDARVDVERLIDTGLLPAADGQR